MRHSLLAICLDFGDTLADEGTEVKDDTHTTLRADLIPGAGDLVRELKRRGYKLALVADGRPGTYFNVLSQHQLYDLFDVHTVSEHVGVEKPDARMFHAAMGQLGIGVEDYSRVMMVGNNLERDIQGANAVGMISVWLDWAPRRSKVPAGDSQIPQHTIKTPLELLQLIDRVEQGMASNGR